MSEGSDLSGVVRFEVRTSGWCWGRILGSTLWARILLRVKHVDVFIEKQGCHVLYFSVVFFFRTYNCPRKLYLFSKSSIWCSSKKCQKHSALWFAFKRRKRLPKIADEWSLQLCSTASCMLEIDYFAFQLEQKTKKKAVTWLLEENRHSLSQFGKTSLEFFKKRMRILV